MVRHKNRYIVVTIKKSHQEKWTPLLLSQETMTHQILKKIQQMHGDFGEAAVRQGFQVKYCNALTKIAIIRARHGPHILVTSTLPLITKLQGSDKSVNILYVGATIRQAYKFIKNYQQRKFDEGCIEFIKSEEDRENLRSALLNFEELSRQLNS